MNTPDDSGSARQQVRPVKKPWQAPEIHSLEEPLIGSGVVPIQDEGGHGAGSTPFGS